MTMRSIAAIGARSTFTWALALGAASLATSAQAFNFSSSGTWQDPVGGSTIVNTGNEIRWGTALVTSQQSGLSFAGNTGAANFGNVFKLGDLSHFNNPVRGGTAIDSVDLALNLDFGGSLPIAAQSFLFKLAIDETPNVQPCLYPGVSICPDKISWENTVSTTTFSVNQTTYTLELLGFSLLPASSPVNEFFSEENGTNTVSLYGKVVETTAVPEPMTIAGLAIAGAGLAAVRRRAKS